MALDKIEYDKQFMLHIGAWRAAMGQTNSTNVVDHVSFLLEHAVELMGRFPEEAKTIRPTLWENVGAYGRHAIIGELENKLHAKFAHPDYEYQSTENHEAVDTTVPNGYGWVVNQAYCDGDTEDRGYITHYWRRLKSDAIHDDIDPFDKDQLRIEPPKPLEFHEYLAMLVEHIPDGDLKIPADPSESGDNQLLIHKRMCEAYAMMRKVPAHMRPSFLPKPKYFDNGTFVHRLEPGLNVLQMTAYDNTPGWDVICPNPEIKAVRSDLYWMTDLGHVQILTHLANFYKGTFVRATRKDGDYGTFRPWSWYPPLNVDRRLVKDKLENPWG